MKTSIVKKWGGHFLLLLLICLLPAERAVADDLLDADKGFYSVYLSGSATIAFSMPCYNAHGEDSWINSGYLNVTWTDDDGNSHTKTVIHWGRSTVCDDISTGVNMNFSSDVPGTVKVSDVTISGSGTTVLLWPFNENWVKAEGAWKLPYELLGHKNKSRSLKFSWSAEMERTAWTWTETITGFDTKNIDVPPAPDKITPQVTMATLTLDKANTIEVPWFMANENLTKISYEYTNASGDHVSVPMSTKKSSGSIPLDCNVPHKDFYVKVSYIDVNDFEMEDICSDPIDLTMIHAPVGLTATSLGGEKAKVRLDWRVDHTDTEDITTTDFFEIQRSLTGKEDDYETIGTVTFSLDATNNAFTFTDSTVVKSLMGGMLTGGNSLPNLSYRVRRMITQDWGWDGNVCAQKVTCPLSGLHLKGFSNYAASWENEQSFTVRVTWSLDNSAGAVWDSRAQWILRVVKTNSSGEQVASNEYVLTDDDRTAGYKILDFSHTCVNYQIEPIVTPGTSPLTASATGSGTVPAHHFYHEGNGTVSKELLPQTQQSSVVLTWEVEGGVVDYYQVLRRPEGGGESDWIIVADHLEELGYEDTGVSPLQTYEYKVRAVTDCEGLHYSETNVVKGACKNTGRVSGYVRMQDGTGVAGIDVRVSAGSTSVTVTTDAKGYYMADNLSYQGKQSITYTVQPLSSGANPIQLEDGVDQRTATFDDRANDRELKEFTITNSYRFSGFVMYDGTSIPVKGAHFTVNGREVHDATGQPIETSFDGSFSFRVLSGKNIIQAVMDGHRFTDGGYLKSAEGYVFTDHLDQIYFYDETKVKLTGRVVGGDDQGLLPLDHNLSRNNLGDRLTMVLTLEGDNTSWLIYDNLNPGLSVRKDSISHPGGGDYKTRFTVQRKRMEVRPDSLTGEFVLMLPPVRWKVQQIYCNGYPTLFQDGQVSEVIDLTDCLTPKTVSYQGTYYGRDSVAVINPTETYNYCYRRIYHTPVEITYRQIGYDTFSYFGDKSYIAQSLSSAPVEVPLAYQDKDKQTQYTFGYPVFSIERKYPIEIQVCERYLYNNDSRAGKVDQVNIGGGTVTVHNGMEDGLTRQTVKLDNEGRGRFSLKAGQTVRLLTSKDALRTVSMTLEQDGITYEAKPLQGYILNMFSMNGAKDVISASKPVLIDVLRDPPGGGSSATLSKGSNLKLSYQVDMNFKSGISIGFGLGSQFDNYSGMISGMTEYGLINGGETYDLINLDIIFSGSGNKAYSYTMSLNEDISTSSAPNMVGADADVYIGLVQNMVVTPMSTIRAIPNSMYQLMLGRNAGNLADKSSWSPTNNKYGTLVHIAEGRDQNDSIFHLVRDESLAYGPQVTSHFIYTQHHIVNEVLPKLSKEIFDMIFTGTKAEAQAKANSTGKVVYLSTVPVSDPDFGIKYEPVTPTNNPNYVNELLNKYDILKSWLDIISTNEYEKLSAYDLVANYAIDGGTNMTHTETFEADVTHSENINYPFTTADYFGEDGTDDNDRGWAAGATLASQPAVASALNLLAKLMSKGSTGGFGTTNNKDLWGNALQLEYTGFKFNFSLTPVAEYTSKGTYGFDKSYSRKESFTIAPASKSLLDVDVLRVKTQPAKDETKSNGFFDVYTNINFNSMVSTVNGHLGSGIETGNTTYARSFVYRTKGGATANPWEDERRTIAYRAGTLLDERTKKIVNPKLKMDKQSISGVSVGDPARFKVYLSNESEYPEAISGSLCMLNLYLDEASNPKGAKIFVDGTPLNSNGIDVYIEPGQLVQKTIEVYAGDEFDYDSLKVVLTQTDDWVHVYDEVLFDVHFLHEAGPVNISVPGDQWVMNTDAEYDSKRGWFIPVTIDGFNKHQHNFDHIEFQYKESRRGDNSWTNLCSFFADEQLMEAATGERAMIPENGNIRYDFYGEGPVMEMAYDLRAVLYCRNGNSFLTTSSKIISGVKDTRRPQLFGSPEPTDGIISAGENIVFNFSEDIEYNYLNKVTNFEVKGEVNNANVSEMVSLQFLGHASVESEAERNFSGKDLTIDLMVRPAETGREMPLFSHGTNGKKLQLWLTSDFKLKAVVDDQTFVSTDAIAKNMFTQVAMVIKAPSTTLTGDNSPAGTLKLFNGGTEIGSFELDKAYNGTGTLIFGRTNETDRTRSYYYEGRMMEARLWYRALDAGLLGTTYGNRRLSGYELGLVDYYPMNEGSGDYALDKTQGANATLQGATWAMPRGLSLRLNGDGVALTQDAMNRTAEQDYTLMFWFRTEAEYGTLVANGRGLSEDQGAEDQFFIGIDQRKLFYRSNGHTFELGDTYSDGEWHHYAMTVNRSRGVANIYIDQKQLASFSPDSLGGISGGYPGIGVTRYTTQEGSGSSTPLYGHVDELCFFAQALPPALLDTYSKKSPNGDEVGMLTYLSFDRQERQKDNSIELVAYPYSKKIYLDADGNVRYELDPETQQATLTPMRDYVFEASPEDILARIDATMAAPVVPYEELKNLSFDFVGKDNQLLIALKEQSARLNRRNVYVTVRDVEDKNGNAMISPQTACFYVSNSSLQWQNNQLSFPVSYGYGDYIWFDIVNNTATSHTYTIENCPKWLTLNSYSDIVSPQSTATINAQVNPGLNVGTYDEVIYLVDEDGVTEPLYLTVVVAGETPDWVGYLSGSILEYTMNLTGKVYINGEIDIDSRDIVGVFDRDNVCHGYANISYSALTGESDLFLTVYDNSIEGRELYFKLWQYSTGLQLMLAVNGQASITFKQSAVMGTDEQVRFDGGSSFVQVFDLQEGWNWVSFNVASDNLLDMNNLLAGLPWQNGDLLTDLNTNLTMLYNGKTWLASATIRNLALTPTKSYAIKVKNAIKFPIAGSIIQAEDMRTITLKEGWNGIGYTPMLNLSVETALSDYYDKAQPGDIIKSHDQFAYFTKSGGVGRWRGNLQYLRPGEGYMMMRKDATEATFRYPYYEPGSTFIDEWATSGADYYRAPATHRSTMSLMATVAGVDIMAGDKLVAYADGERVGETHPQPLSCREGQRESLLFYLSIAGDKRQGIWFAIERDGQIVAHTQEVMTFRANDVVGSPDVPTAIHFTRTDIGGEQWYSPSGIKLPGKPVAKGVYIYNGKKIVIR